MNITNTMSKVDVEKGVIVLARPKTQALPLLVLSILYLPFGWTSLVFCIGSYIGALLGIICSSLLLALCRYGGLERSRVAELVDIRNLFISASAFFLAGFCLHAYMANAYTQMIPYTPPTPYFTVDVSFSIIATILSLFASIIAGVSAHTLSRQLQQMRVQGLDVPDPCAC